MDSLVKAAATLAQSDTTIIIQGHRLKGIRRHQTTATRMTAIGFGSHRPTVPNDAETKRALNRRVQLEISPNEKARAEGTEAIQ